eukprot:823314-Rhodomonas_salina.2
MRATASARAGTTDPTLSRRHFGRPFFFCNGSYKAGVTCHGHVTWVCGAGDAVKRGDVVCVLRKVLGDQNKNEPLPPPVEIRAPAD